MSGIDNLFPNYFGFLTENKISKYLQCKFSCSSFDSLDDTEKLWQIHDKALQDKVIEEVEPKQSLLHLKIELASRMFKNCHFCERRCEIDRRKKSGNCGVLKPLVASEFLHVGEEHILIPSYTVFFSGCTFHCVFCQNWDISQNTSGVYLEPRKLADLIATRKKQGAKNVNWVGGDPTPDLLFILKVLKECSTNIPQVWNSNMYCSTETMQLLQNVIDMYLTDFKYGTDECAKHLSKVDNYTAIVKRNHKIAYHNGEMIIRHLVMPNHVECCSKPVIKWIARNLPSAAVNIMAQYRPEYKAYDYKDISRSVSTEEFLEVKKFADQLNIHEV